MLLPKRLAAALVITSILTAGGWLAADEKAPSEAAQAPPASPAAPPAAQHQNGTQEPDTQQIQPPLSSFSLQTLVDERRDLLRRRREERQGTYGDPRETIPPWFADYDAAVERYRDARRSWYRQKRTFDRRRNSSWMDNLCPWSKPQRTWSSPRGYQRQMEPPDRRELHDPFLSRPPFAPPGPARW